MRYFARQLLIFALLFFPVCAFSQSSALGSHGLNVPSSGSFPSTISAPTVNATSVLSIGTTGTVNLCPAGTNTLALSIYAACGNAQVSLEGQTLYFVGGLVGSGDYYGVDGTGVNFPSAHFIAWSSTSSAAGTPDTSVSKCSSLIVCAGNGSQGDYSGTYKSTNLITSPVAVASLPASPTDGERAFVNNVMACVFATAVVSGGTTHCPVYYDGSSSSWKAG